MKRLHSSLLVFSTCLLLGSRATPRDEIDKRIAEMSDDEKIAQLLFVGFEGTTTTPELRRLIAEQGVGGVVIYGRNITSGEQVRVLNQEIRRLASSGVPPFIAIDQEGGSVERLRDTVPRLPGNMALGATRSASLSRRAGQALGASLRELGFTMNFAPVLDTLTEPENAAIGNRSFSDDPRLVAALGAAFSEGQQSAGVAAVAKHFPGQGGVRADSHYRLPVLDQSLSGLRKRELVPFREAIGAGVCGIMTSHVAVPLVAETPTTPATFSSRLLTSLLRQEMRFDGIVITDELEMRSISSAERPGAAALRAILAGADMVLTVWSPADRRAAFATLLEAYKQGLLTDARLRQSLRRILRLKLLLATPPTAVPPDAAVSRDIARSAVTIIGRRDVDRVITSSHRRVFVGAPGAVRNAVAVDGVINTPPRVDRDIIAKASALVSGADLLIFAIASPNDRALLAALREAHPMVSMIVVELGMPGGHRPAATSVVLAYDDGPESQSAAAAVLQGTLRPRGTSPIRLPPR